MEVLTIQDLRKNTDVYVDLYGKCKELSKSCLSFKNPPNNKAKKILEKWIFFRAVNYCFEQMLIIELCKLVQQNHNTQKYNINKFVNTLSKLHSLLEYKDKLPILTIRDKHFTHIENIDRYFKKSIEIDFSQINYLLSIIETILTEIYSAVYDSDLFLDSDIIRFESIIDIVLERNVYLEKFGDLND
jgi:hypothetical protein